MKNSPEFWKKPLCFVSFLLLLSHYFTNCYFSFSLKGSPLSLLHYRRSSIFSPSPLKPIPAWYYSQIWLLLLLLYGCSKPVAPYSSLDGKYEVEIWFLLLVSPYPCPVTHLTWRRFSPPFCVSDRERLLSSFSFRPINWGLFLICFSVRYALLLSWFWLGQG